MAGMAKAREMLTVPELCEELGISSSTFYDWRLKRRAPVASSSRTEPSACAGSSLRSG